jgi:hypothetical protein
MHIYIYICIYIFVHIHVDVERKNIIISDIISIIRMEKSMMPWVHMKVSMHVCMYIYICAQTNTSVYTCI